MITYDEAPVWFDYVELDDNLNERLRDDAPQEVKDAYEQHLRDVSEMSRNGQYMVKA